MAHFARLDDYTGEVLEVLVVNNAVITDENGVEQEELGREFLTQLYGSATWVQTSYNHRFRYNYAVVGGIYDPTRDAFISPKPYASWTLNETTCRWQAPIPYPGDGFTYMWSENRQEWIAMPEDDRYYRWSYFYEQWMPKPGEEYIWDPELQNWRLENPDV